MVTGMDDVMSVESAYGGGRGHRLPSPTHQLSLIGHRRPLPCTRRTCHHPAEGPARQVGQEEILRLNASLEERAPARRSYGNNQEQGFFSYSVHDLHSLTSIHGFWQLADREIGASAASEHL
jgi:hypothetical protein